MFIVPALDEEVTIADSVNRLREVNAKHRTILVIDDGSTDRTPEVLAAMAGPDLEVLRRDPPNARKGKAAALNAAWQHVRSTVMQRPSFAHANDDNTIFVIVDADGRLDPEAPAAIAAQMQDPQVGGVQLGVLGSTTASIRLTWMQDVGSASTEGCTRLAGPSGARNGR